MFPDVNVTTPFIGCIRNLIINNMHYMDFSEPLMEEGLSTSCVFNDRNCYQTPCNNRGECIGRWDSYQCICTPEYTGVTCDESN